MIGIIIFVYRIAKVGQHRGRAFVVVNGEHEGVRSRYWRWFEMGTQQGRNE